MFDENRMSYSTRVKIEKFKEKYSETSWGPAHIVFDDENLLNGHLEFCIGVCDEWLRIGRGDRKEVIDTKIFLQELLSIPEEDR